MSARILLVEDNPENRELMAYLFRAFGYLPVIARDGVEGLEMARHRVPDVVVTDLTMPRMDGYRLLRELRADPVLQHVPVVAVTALAMVGDRAGVLDAGFDGYVTKPIEPETFVAGIEHFLPASEDGARASRPPPGGD